MKKKTGILKKSILGIVLVSGVAVFILFMGIRSEFSQYLKQRYPGQSFRVGFIKIDPIYGSYIAEVTCLNDEVRFPISKSFDTKNINEDYPQQKSRLQYNSKLKSIFAASEVKSSIGTVIGGGKNPFDDSGKYDQIYVDISPSAEHISTIKKAMNVLRENNISSECIMFSYEKDKGVYEVILSSNDYDLTEKQIEDKVEKIK
jgi:hypothetical protein